MSARQRRPRDTGSVVVRKRADGRESYMLKWKSYTETVAAGSKGEALRLLPAFVTKAKAGHFEDKRRAAKDYGEQPTLKEWCDRFLENHVSMDPDKLATKVTFSKVLRVYVLPGLSDLKLSDVSWDDVRDRFRTVRAEGKSLGTLKLAYAALRLAMNAAVEDKVLAASPLRSFKKLKLGDVAHSSEVAHRSALSLPQLKALLAACADDAPVHLWISIMASCGVRPGEANGLLWEDVNLAEGVMHVRNVAKKVWGKGMPARKWIGRPKTASGLRTVSIGPALVALFQAERQRQEATMRALLGRDPAVRDLVALVPEDACIFHEDPSTPEGLREPRDPSTFRDQFKRYAVKAGLPAPVTPHWLRHTSISHALANGAPLADASRRAGHKNPAVTAAIYTHAVGEGERKAALLGDGLLAPGELATVEQLANAASDK